MSKVEGGGRVDVDVEGGAGDIANGIVNDSPVEKEVVGYSCFLTAVGKFEDFGATRIGVPGGCRCEGLLLF